jgi:hypothetical protein
MAISNNVISHSLVEIGLKRARSSGAIFGIEKLVSVSIIADLL